MVTQNRLGPRLPTGRPRRRGIGGTVGLSGQAGDAATEVGAIKVSLAEVGAAKPSAVVAAAAKVTVSDFAVTEVEAAKEAATEVAAAEVAVGEVAALVTSGVGFPSAGWIGPAVGSWDGALLPSDA
ncbi:MAG: hypothetical protein LBJ61_02655, partial [Deltaproteobacteria bacterium]|nr:hypothetical protein [Deltaproteobacteria bacterium]